MSDVRGAVAMSSDPRLSIPDRVGVLAATAPQGVAIVGHGRAPLTYGRLHLHLLEVGCALNALGVGRDARVALVAPSGPETAVALLAVAASATCIPLNPSYSVDEFAFYLADARANAVMVSVDIDSPVRLSARQRGIPIIELSAQQNGTAGLIALTGDAPRRAVNGGVSGPDDTAVVFYTSGTVDRPKKVPLTHATICIRAHERVRAFGLTDQDRCLTLMPLFYYSGFGTLTSTLAAGASIAWPAGSDPGAFFAALDECRPSWYAAPPAAQTALLARAADDAGVIAERPLRFIRCGTAALAPQVLTEVERVFRAPVVVTYGSTEAGRVSSSSLPPAPRKPGSVGLVDAARVAILDGAGRTLPAGEVGEIAVRGPGVFDGYEDDPAATNAAFVDGWFKMGDRGVVDADGFLFIQGRIKEMVNRGGAKVSPRAVEDVLLVHPAVQEAVAFGMPHRTLGEDLASAVVLRTDAHASERELREFAAARLADVEVPSRVVVVSEIPKGPTGKVQRNRLAERLSAALASPHVTPTTPTEQAIAEIWARELGVRDVGIHDNFFALGGDSLSAARVVNEIHQRFGTALPLAILLRASTVSEMARLVGQAGVAPPGPRWWPCGRTAPGRRCSASTAREATS